jgi:hypothetical protein
VNISIRILPHHQNTGGFFLAIFSKSKPMPPSAAFLQAQKYKLQKNGVPELEQEKEEGVQSIEEDDIEVAMMEELTFGRLCFFSTFLFFCGFRILLV